MAKFAIDKNESASIILSLFITTKNFYFCMSFDILELFNSNTCKQIVK